jgi:hypothetical protein
MLTVPSKVGNPQDQVTHFLAQLYQLYQEAKSERLEVARSYPVSNDGFSILEELEFLTVNISGYATQIQSAGLVKLPEKAIADLRTFKVFENDVITQFYQDANNTYPKLNAYIQLLDYLRLLSLEYLQVSEQPYSISA